MKSKGFTLVELLVTIIAGSIVAISVGMLLTDFSRVLFRARASSAVNIEYQIAKATLRNSLMKARELITDSSDLIAGKEDIEFRNVYGETILINRDDGESEIWTNKDSSPDQLVLSDAVDLLFFHPVISTAPGALPSENIISVFIEQEKISAYAGEDPIVEKSSATFNIFLRNLK